MKDSKTAEIPAPTNVAPVAPVAPTRNELVLAADAAFENLNAVKKDAAKTDADKFAAKMAWIKADDNLSKFDAAVKANEAKIAHDLKIEAAKNVLADFFGIPRTKLDELGTLKQADDKGIVNPVYAAIQTIFGKPVIYAKQGQTGQSLTGAAKSNGNGTGSKYLAIAAEMVGKTREQILAEGHTASDINNASYQYNKANPTAKMTVVNKVYTI